MLTCALHFVSKARFCMNKFEVLCRIVNWCFCFGFRVFCIRDRSGGSGGGGNIGSGNVGLSKAAG